MSTAEPFCNTLCLPNLLEPSIPTKMQKLSPVETTTEADSPRLLPHRRDRQARRYVKIPTVRQRELSRGIRETEFSHLYASLTPTHPFAMTSFKDPFSRATSPTQPSNPRASWGPALQLLICILPLHITLYDIRTSPLEEAKLRIEASML